MVFELLIELEGVEPKIYRKLRVDSDIQMRDLHHAIQLSMGWENKHLYYFDAAGEKITQIDFLEDDDFVEDHEVSLDEYLHGENDSLTYIYDLGDKWTHRVSVLKALDSDESPHIPYCVEGKRNCPPEDVGSIAGYKEFVAIMADPRLPEHEEKVDWYGGPYDPEQFRIDIVNEDLEEFDEYIDSFGDDWLHL